MPALPRSVSYRLSSPFTLPVMWVTPAATILSATDSSDVWGGVPYLIVGR